MPWMELSIMSQRLEFIMLATAEGGNIAELCRRFGISRKTGYKWIGRFERAGPEDLADRSRRPHRSPRRTPKATERLVLELRRKHPVWGGRKIHFRLRDLGYRSLPVPSTITEILRRHGQLDERESAKRQPFKRFEHERPNDLWQMDFKGDFELRRGRCHPLTVLDDHSRFSVGLQACGNEQGTTVQQRLTEIFRRYGLPRRMLMDNGSPWGSDEKHRHTPLTVWLIRLGIGVTHSRPYHPQTQGKDERFHRTMKAEVLAGREFLDLHHCQVHFDRWRQLYNFERPHDSLGMNVPASRYRVSDRPYLDRLPGIEYGPDDIVRKVQQGGDFRYRGHLCKVSKAFLGQRIALRPTTCEGVLDVYFCQEHLGRLNLRTARRGGGTRRLAVVASVRSAHSSDHRGE